MPSANRVPDSIAHQARALIARCGTDDPFSIAEQLGIVLLQPSASLGRLKGMYHIIKGVRFIFLNSENSPQMNRIVCAHELGHDQLHRDYARKNPLREFTLYDMSIRPEYEANLFAANLLLEDETVLSLVAEGCTTEKIAAITACDVNLVALKIDTLIREGHALRQQPHDTQFLQSARG